MTRVPKGILAKRSCSRTWQRWSPLLVCGLSSISVAHGAKRYSSTLFGKRAGAKLILVGI